MSSEIGEERPLLPANPSIPDKILIYISTVLLVTMILLIISQVLIRIFSIQVNSFWITPLSQVLLIVGTYLGSAVATRSDQHIKLNFVKAKISDKNSSIGKAVDLVSRMAVLVTLLIILISTTQATTSAWNTVFGSVEAIKTGYIYLIMSVSIALMIVFELNKMFTTH